MNYPKRGEMSEDGKYYTHTDGSVHNRIERKLSEYCGDKPCSLYDKEGDCPPYVNYEPCRYSLVKGAYVPSAEEQEACDMARAAIQNCSTHYYWSRPMDIRTCEHNMNHCHSCSCLTAKSCPSRAYLAAHGDANAWEVMP